MGGNSQPQFTRDGNIQSVAITAAGTSSEGGIVIGTSGFLAFVADATNGSYVDFLRLFPTASAASTAMAATVCRIFVASISTGTTTTATAWCIGEVALPAQTVDAPTAAFNPIDYPLGFRLPAGYAILVTNHAAPNASTQWQATVFGGDY